MEDNSLAQINPNPLEWWTSNLKYLMSGQSATAAWWIFNGIIAILGIVVVKKLTK